MNSELDSAVAALFNPNAYQPCLVLVHREIRRLETAAKEFAEREGWHHLSVGRELSAVLFSVPATERAYWARSWVETTLASAAPGPVFLSDIDLLFEPALHLDVLILLRQASRTTRLVVAWPGAFENGTLAYAVPEHHHHRTWLRPEVSIVTLD